MTAPTPNRSLPTRRKPTSSTRRAKRPTSTLAALPLFGLVLAVAAFAYIAIRPPSVDDKAYAGVLTFPLLLALMYLITARAAREETRFDLRSIMIAGFALRGVGTVARYLQPVDALVYHREGIRIADDIRAFDLFPDAGREIPGTGWIRYMSGVIHVVDFDDMITSFLIFTCLSFIGCYLCYRAFTCAVPEGNHRRYALLVFLWPSLLYWPSSLGKEAWMIFGLGITSWGVSRVLTGRAGVGLLTFVLGLGVMTLVRPHVALMCMVGFTVALFVRSPNKKTSARTAARVISIGLLIVGGAFVAGKANELLKTDAQGTEGITNALDNTVAQTSQGGAAFTPIVVRTPLEYPLAFVTVWFRPFPNEARGGGGGLPQYASAAENLFLLGLVLASWKRLRYLPRALLRIPYVTYAFVYCLVFVYAFAAIGNFGILARQRTQGTILLFVILCLPDLSANRRASARRVAATTTGIADRAASADAAGEPAEAADAADAAEAADGPVGRASGDTARGRGTDDEQPLEVGAPRRTRRRT